MFVSGGKPLLLLEGVQPGTLERGVSPLAGRDVEKAVDCPDQLALCIVQRIDADGYDQCRAIGMFDDTLYVTHGLAGCEDFGNQRARDWCSVHFKETDAFPELIVRLAWARSRAPDRHRMALY